MAVVHPMKSFQSYITEKHEGDGDCMEAAVKLMMRSYTDYYGERFKPASGSPVLVHGLVHGQGSLKGKRFVHAWVESGGMVYDYSNGGENELTQSQYYRIGKIDPKQKGAYFKYSYSDMKKKLLSTGHYGPWDIDMSLEEATMIKRIGRKRKSVSPEILKLLK